MRGLLWVILAMAMSFTVPSRAADTPSQTGVMKPLATLEMECYKNISDSCFDAMLMYLGDTAADENVAKSEFYMKRACDTGNAIACSTFAARLSKYKNVSPSTVGDYAWKGCNLGDVEGCKFAVFYTQGDTPAIADAKKRREVAEKSCDAGFVNGCGKGAYFAALEKDWEAVIVLAEKGCSLGEKSLCGRTEKYAQLAKDRRKIDADLKNRERIRTEVLRSPDHALKYARETGDYAKAADYLFAQHPNPGSLMVTNPAGDTLALVFVEAGKNGVKAFSDKVIYGATNHWTGNTKASKLRGDEWMRREKTMVYRAQYAEREKQRMAMEERNRQDPSEASYIGTAGTGRTAYKPKQSHGFYTCTYHPGTGGGTLCKPAF